LIECGRCTQRTWPERAEPYRTTNTFDEHTVPAGLLADHRTKARVWGRLEVLSGALVLCFAPPLDERMTVTAGEWAAIPPELPHHVELTGPVEFRVVFCRSPDSPSARRHRTG
jgi:ferredoxin